MANPANNIIGIDLGTTTTLVARFNENGTPEILPNRAGQDMTPSVIQILDSGEWIIGEEAKKYLGSGAPNVFAEFKRDMGSGRTWQVAGQTITPVDLSARLLKQVVEECAEQFGQPTSIVVSWPANFGQAERKATMEAAKQAGLHVELFTPEPSAAALYYARDGALEGHYLVYDFGGGTFDVTVLHANGNDVRILWTEGVQQLGGKDIDERLLRLIGKKFKARTGADLDPIDCSLAKPQVEGVKHTLSVREKTETRLLSEAYGPVVIGVTREELETDISDLVTQAEIMCERALQRSNLSKDDIREVFMAGGTSRIPIMQQSVEKLFGKKPIVKNPDRAVALGACIYAGMRAKGTLTAEQEPPPDANFGDITPYFFGTLILDRDGVPANATLIAKGLPLPQSVTQTFGTVADGQKRVNCTVTQSAVEETDPTFVTKMKEMFLTLDPPSPRGRQIQVTYSYDLNGMMRCEFKDMLTGQTVEIDLDVNRKD